jgi:HK97 family phage portal protein
VSGILAGLFERRALDEATAAGLLAQARGLWSTAAGITVTPETALRSTAVFACVRLLAETTSCLPLPTFRRLARGKEHARDLSLYGVLHDVANPEMTAQNLRENLVSHVALRGDAWSEIEYNGAGDITALWPLRPDRSHWERGQDGQLWLVTQLPSGQYVGLPRWRVWHIRGFGTDPYRGLSPIGVAREAVALAIATEQYGAAYFGNASEPRGVLKTASKLKDPEKLRISWEAMHSGLSNAHRIAVLEEGVEWQQLGLGNADSQFLETRKYQVNDIARLYGIQPHKIGDLERSTNNNIEQQALEFLQETLLAWLVRIESSAAKDLLTALQRKEYFSKHEVKGLLRGDAAARASWYTFTRQWGIYSANDIRELEDENPIPGGDSYLVPLNMIPADQVGQLSAGNRALLLAASEGMHPSITDGGTERRPPLRMLESGGLPGLVLRGNNQGSGGPETRRRIAERYRRLITDAGGRILRREEADVMRQARKMLVQRAAPDFLNWLNEFYGEHPEFIGRNYLPVFQSLAEQIAEDAAAQVDGEVPGDLPDFVRDYTDVAAARYCWNSFNQLRQVLNAAQLADADLVQALQTRFDEWREGSNGSANRAQKQGAKHSVRCQNAVSRFAWLRNGIQRLGWVTHGENCPYCNALRGRVVGIQDVFLRANEDFQPEGAETVLRPRSHIGHAPAHDGCNCSVEPK